MIQLVLSSKLKRNISFNNIITIGRQSLHLSKEQLKEALNKFDFNVDNIASITDINDRFSEGLFKFCGAKKVDSLDASNYENATVICDMNKPISKNLEKYDLVLDSGTLEHVFNFPQAILNCMNLTKKGGHFIGIYPCNNFFGHGFYQFSSETFYRAFSNENGFKVVDVILFVDEPNTTYYSVLDTEETDQRTVFNNTKPVYIYVLALKVEETSIFNTFPLQTDYSEFKWKGSSNQISSRKKKRKSKISLKKIMPSYFKNLGKALLNIKVKDEVNFNKPYFSIYKLK